MASPKSKMNRLFPILFLLFVFSCEDKEVLTQFEGDILLNIYEKKYFSEEIKIEFLDVVNESRCPLDGICIWPGNARVLLRFNQKGLPKGINIYLDSYGNQRTIYLLNYKIKLRELSPYPQISNIIRKFDYSMILNVEQID